MTNDYIVRINGREVARVATEEEAWEIIGEAPFGSGHVVTDSNGNVREEFVPF